MKKILLLILIVTATCRLTSAQYTKIFDFDGPNSGSWPQFDQGLVSDGTFLYGLTNTGGTNDFGTAFKIMPDGTGYMKLMDFTGTANGHHPCGSFTFDGTYLYSTTAGGGANNAGTIFKIMPDGTGYQKLLDFVHNTSGYGATGHLTFDGTHIYGMTQEGGTYDYGTIFKIQTNGTGFTTLLNFNGTNGTYPFGGLVTDGTYLYGMTRYAGVNGNGAIFKIMPDGTGFSRIFDFGDTLTGMRPSGSLAYDGANLYGMTPIGGLNNMGVIFKVATDGTNFTKLHDFSGTADGDGPEGTLLVLGQTLYGMTYEGGANNKGAIFKIEKDGTNFVNMLDFVLGTTTGCNSMGSLTSDGFYLYGMTHSGGTSNKGVIFKMDLGVGIDANDFMQHLFVSPNPFENTVTLIGTSGEGEITLYDIAGKELLRLASLNESTDINTEKLFAGYYFVRYQDREKTGVFRMMKF
ncbi:MAG: choice-of-anchor tandem repeat GloVer-containing protein [Bacteroidota bacterium]